jgi:TetR/AcrR family transcriptional regulator, tetracycline repressor protein
MPLRRDTVIDTALELLDEVGLDALTTRAVTSRLGVQPGALYWHVRNKRELLTAVAERIMDEVYDTPSTAEDWAVGVVDFAHAMRAALLRHRDGARLIATHTPLGPAALRTAEAGLAALRAAGIPLALAARFGDTIASYVTGFVLQEQAAEPAGSGFEAPDPAEFPHLMEWAATESPPDRDAAFDTGVSLIVAGLRVAMATPPGQV